jgi:transcriptional regulator with XRE-family HTH domain
LCRLQQAFIHVKGKIRHMNPLLLKAARKQQGWSQARVAEELGITERTVRRWEQGLVVPYPYYRLQLCALFGKTAQDLGLPPESDEYEDLDECEDLEEVPIPLTQPPKQDVLVEEKGKEAPKQPSHKGRRLVQVILLFVIIGLLAYAFGPSLMSTILRTSVRRISYEAESSQNIWTGFAEPVSCSGCSGGYRVCCLSTQSNGQNGTLQFNNVDKSIAGSYTMTIYYTEGDPGSRTGYVSVNGGAAILYTGVYTGNWHTVEAINMTISLSAGNSTIKFFNPNGPGPDIDRVVV